MPGVRTYPRSPLGRPGSYAPWVAVSFCPSPLSRGERARARTSPPWTAPLGAGRTWRNGLALGLLRTNGPIAEEGRVHAIQGQIDGLSG